MENPGTSQPVKPLRKRVTVDTEVLGRASADVMFALCSRLAETGEKLGLSWEPRVSSMVLKLLEKEDAI